MEHYFEKNIVKLNNLLIMAVNTDKKLSVYRLLTFLITIIFGLFFYFSELKSISIAVFITGMIVFSVLAHYHSRLNDKIERLKKWLAFKKTQLARRKINWDNIPSPPLHDNKIYPVERDLNLVGERSLIHLISTCTTFRGTETLRKSLSNTIPDLKEIIRKQNLIKDCWYH